MKELKKIAAAVLTMTMTVGLAVAGYSGRGGSNGIGGALAEQSKEIRGGGTNSSRDDTARADDDALHLTFYYPVSVGGSATQLIEKVCTDFNVKNPGIFVGPVYTGNYDDTVTEIQVTMQGGTPPDVLVSLATQRFTMTSTDITMPLSELTEADGEKGKAYIDDFLPSFVEDSYADGKIYSIPFQKSTMVLYCNKGAFKEAGLDPETLLATWEELAEYDQRLTDDGRYGVGIVLNPSSAQWTFTDFYLQNSTDGQSLMSKDGKSVCFNTPENVETLQFWLDLQNEYKCIAEGIVQWTDLSTQFLAGEVAMIYHTTGNMANVHDNANFDFGTASLPTHKRMGAPTGGGNFYISSDISGDRVQTAWKFIEFTTSTNKAVQWSLDTDYVATRQSCFDTDLIKGYYAEVPQASVAYGQLPYTKSELIIYNAAEIQRVLNDNIQAAAVDDMFVRKALDMAQEQTEEVLSEYQ